jgi:hypothetical protein
LLINVFPNETKALTLLKQGEELLSTMRDQTTEDRLDIQQLECLLSTYFEPACQLAPGLQLPWILKSKVLGEMGQFEAARRDACCAHKLNTCNKRGLVSEKLVGWIEQMRQAKVDCPLKDIKTQMQACFSLCSDSNSAPNSSDYLLETLKSHLNMISIKDWECILCLETFVEPISSPCGHVFCRSCIITSLEHNLSCPCCRQSLPSIGYFLRRPVHYIIQQLLCALGFKPVIPKSINVFEKQWLPLYCCPLILPGTTVNLHFGEPWERLMFHRSVENKKLAVMLPRCKEKNIIFGTVVNIDQWEPLLSCDVVTTCDGNLPRYVATVTALYIFRLEDVRQIDGYHEGLVTRMEDRCVEDYAWDPKMMEQLVQHSRQKISRLLGCMSDTARLHLERKFGVMPNEVAKFCFWLAQVLPIGQITLYELLTLRSDEDRLRLICHWLDTACPDG